jgi:hypothetical protein
MSAEAIESAAADGRGPGAGRGPGLVRHGTGRLLAGVHAGAEPVDRLCVPAYESLNRWRVPISRAAFATALCSQ